MAIETVEDIIEDLADKLGVYGAHEEEGKEHEDRPCRVCFTSGLKTRLSLAFDLEAKISTMERLLKESR